MNTDPKYDPYMYALFDTLIDPDTRRYLSEDYTFCRRWQEIGGTIWMDPSINLDHQGTYVFKGNIGNQFVVQEQITDEVAAQMIKTVADANKDLVDLHKKLKDINKETNNVKNVTNNALFVGSTKELQMMMKEQHKLLEQDDMRDAED